MPRTDGRFGPVRRSGISRFPSPRRGRSREPSFTACGMVCLQNLMDCQGRSRLATGSDIFVAPPWHTRRVAVAVSLVRVDILSQGSTPAIYGGAGRHVAELTRASAPRDMTCVPCFGAPRDGDDRYADPVELGGANAALVTMGSTSPWRPSARRDLVHSHTWYANFAGPRREPAQRHMPHVVSAHCLEPMRPWKAEQLGGGYRLSSWVEKTAPNAAADAIIAVSEGMRQDVLKSYPLDRSGQGQGRPQRHRLPTVAAHHDLDVGPLARRRPGQAVGDLRRPITARRAALSPARLPRTPAGRPGRPPCRRTRHPGDHGGRGRRPDGGVGARRARVSWIPEMLPRTGDRDAHRRNRVRLPSVYEPLGIVNLEAMACELSVVATATGGIPEVVVDGETGWLITPIRAGRGRHRTQWTRTRSSPTWPRHSTPP